jgi:AcrR family transcriptional regulator
LARDGLSGFTVSNVTKEANVSRGLINHHFGSMDDLLVAVYENMTASISAAGESALLADGDGKMRLSAMVDTLFSPPLFSRASLRAWLALWGSVAVDARLKAAHRASYGRYRKAMAIAIAMVAEERQVLVDSVGMAATIIALIDGLWIEWCIDPETVKRDAARRLVYRVLEARLGSLK